MALYSYTARDLAGKKIIAEVEAIDIEDLERQLNEKGYLLISQRKKVSLSKLAGKKKIKTKDLIIFSRQFSVMISAGITIQETIRMIVGNTEKKILKEHLAQIYEDMRAGLALSEAMRRSEIFDDFFIGMVKVGEYSGAFDEIMKQVADFYEKDGELRQSVVSALLYPIILSVMGIGVMIYMLVGVIPQFETAFLQMGTGELPLATKLISDTSRFILQYKFPLIIGTVLVIGAACLWLRSEPGRSWANRISLKIPVVKTVVIKLNTARFARCMDILTKSGVTLIQSFDLVDYMITNTVLREKFRGCKENVVAGLSFATALDRSGIFPTMLINMTFVGETTGSLAEIFDKTASFYDGEARQALKMLIQLIEPIMLIVFGFMVAGMVLSVMYPMLELLSTVG